MDKRSITVLCIASIISSAISCEDGWSRFRKNCYRKFISSNVRIRGANEFCQSYGANLTSVLDDAERNFIYDFTTTGMSKDSSYQTVIGGYRESSSASWKWYDGSAFDQQSFFRYGEPSNIGLNLMLRSDRDDRGNADGFFASVHDSWLAHVFVCKKEVTKGSFKCEEEWTASGSSCYRRFANPHIKIRNANDICRRHQATLTSVNSESEKSFLMDFANTGHRSLPEHATVVGGHRLTPRSAWQWYDGSWFSQQRWFVTHGELKMGKVFCCMRLRSDTPVSEGYWKTTHGHLIDRKCDEISYVMVCKKPGSLYCDSETMKKIGGRCTCNADLIDIADTNLPEAKNYRRGEKCIRSVCHTVKHSTSILFMVDSSESITADRWPSMVSFVKQGASRLPNSFRVGFLKFSTKVSESKWVQANWTKEDYESSVPVSYESGQTDTPAALKEARKMFRNDPNTNKIAVLITDGMPVANKYESEAEALEATEKAAKELRSDGIRLTVMGVGPDMKKGISKVLPWLENATTDYFSFYETPDCLKGTDMDKLLEVVCGKK